MVSLPLDSGSGHMLRDIIKTNKYTRYPVVKGDKDHVVGIINIKEVLFRFLSEGAAFTKHELSPYIQPAIHVIETIPIYQLFVKMQREHAHMAILIDEYGGTAGLVTAEDIIEEIVGEIRDEFDTDETPSVQKLGKNRYLLNAKLLISEVNDVLGTEITADQVDTLGGWFLTQHIDAKPGSTIDFEGYTFTVKEIDSHHIITIEADKAE